VDDGYINKNWRKIFLDWDDIRPSELASLEHCFDFYVRKLVTPFKTRSDFTPTKILDKQLSKGFQMGALELVNGCIIPVGNPSNLSLFEKSGLSLHIPENTDVLFIDTETGNDSNDGSEENPLQTLGAAIYYARQSEDIATFQFVYNHLDNPFLIEYSKVKPQDLAWNKNKQIVYDKEETMDSGPQFIYSKQKDLNEIYEHFRITFANWLAALPNGKEFRRKIQDIADEDVPLWVKRKKLDILLNKIPIQWMIGSEPYEMPKEQALRRVDCSTQEKSKCKSLGRCSWNDASNKCMLHVPTTTALEPHKEAPQVVNVPTLMYYKLIDELIRFVEKRRQLFEQKLSYMIDLDNPIRRGNEFIVPEKSAAWYELMRLEWAARVEEKPRYLEEKSVKKEEEAFGIIGPEYSLPESVKTFFDADDPKVTELRKKGSTLESLLGLIGITADDIEPPIIPSTEKLNEIQLKYLVRSTKLILAQLDIRKEIPELIVKKPFAASNTTKVFFLVIEDDEPSILVRDPLALTLPTLSDMPSSIQEKIQAADSIGAPVPNSMRQKVRVRQLAKV
jgi:hypothetical protein